MIDDSIVSRDYWKKHMHLFVGGSTSEDGVVSPPGDSLRVGGDRQDDLVTL
jgi:hypothetical protein